MLRLGTDVPNKAIFSKNVTRTIEFGALTLGANGGYQIIVSNAYPSNVTILAEETNATGVSVSSTGLITPTSTGSLAAQNGRLLTVNTNRGKLKFKLKIIPDAYSYVPNGNALGELGNILALGWTTLSGKTIIGRAGVQRIGQSNYFDMGRTVAQGGSSPGPTAYVTFTSHDINRRPLDTDTCLEFNMDPGTNNWASITYLEFYRVKWVSLWVPGVNSNATNLTLTGTYGWVRWKECNINGKWRELNSLYGPAYTGLDFTYRGFVNPTNGSNPIGPIELIDNDIHDYWRAFQVDINAPNCKIIGNDIHHCAVDHGVITRYNIQPSRPPSAGIDILWNTFHDPLTIVPPPMRVVSVTNDASYSYLVVEDPDNKLASNPTINFNALTEQLPSGATLTRDLLTTTLGRNGILTELRINNSTFTSQGLNCFINLEPSHADFIQSIMNPDETAKNIRLIGNVVFGDPKDPLAEIVGWAQGFFFEDIAGPAEVDENYYESLIAAGNMIWTKSLHGISIYNGLNCIIADNTTTGPSTNVNAKRPQVAVFQQWFSVGRNNIIINNIATKSSSYISSDYVPKGNIPGISNIDVIPGQANYEALNKFIGTNLEFVTDIADFLNNFQRIDLIDKIDYKARTYDLPSINQVGAFSFTNVTNGENGGVATHAPILMNAILDSTGNPSRNGALVSVKNGTAPEFRITSDIAGNNVVVDWTDLPNVITNGQYLWVRDLISGNIQITRTVEVRVGNRSASWTITSGNVDVGKPFLTDIIVFNKLDDSVNFKFTTDESTGIAYYLNNQTPTISAAELKANGASFAVTQAGEQAAIAITGLQSFTQYYLHLMHIDNANNESDVTSSVYTTTSLPAYSDSFLSNTVSQYTAGAAGSFEYDPLLEAIQYNTGGGGFDGFTTRAINVTPGVTYSAEAIIANEDALASAELVVGTTPFGTNLGASQQVISKNIDPVKVTFVGPPGGVVYVTPRYRGTGFGRQLIVLNITVTEGFGIDPIVDDTVFGTALLAEGANTVFYDDFTTNTITYSAPGILTRNTMNGSGGILYYESNRQGFEAITSGVINVIPYQSYIAEAVIYNPANTGQADLIVGKTPGAEDIGISVLRAGARQNTIIDPVNGTFSIGVTVGVPFVAPLRGKVYVSPRWRSASNIAPIEIYGIRVSRTGSNTTLRYADVSPNVSTTTTGSSNGTSNASNSAANSSGSNTSNTGANTTPVTANVILYPFNDDFNTNTVNTYVFVGTLVHDGANGRVAYTTNTSNQFEGFTSSNIAITPNVPYVFEVEAENTEGTNSIDFLITNPGGVTALATANSVNRVNARTRKTIYIDHTPTANTIRIRTRARGNTLGFRFFVYNVAVTAANVFVPPIVQIANGNTTNASSNTGSNTSNGGSNTSNTGSNTANAILYAFNDSFTSNTINTYSYSTGDGILAYDGANAKVSFSTLTANQFTGFLTPNIAVTPGNTYQIYIIAENPIGNNSVDFEIVRPSGTSLVTSNTTNRIGARERNAIYLHWTANVDTIRVRPRARGSANGFSFTYFVEEINVAEISVANAANLILNAGNTSNGASNTSNGASNTSNVINLAFFDTFSTNTVNTYSVQTGGILQYDGANGRVAYTTTSANSFEGFLTSNIAVTPNTVYVVTVRGENPANTNSLDIMIANMAGFQLATSNATNRIAARSNANAVMVVHWTANTSNVRIKTRVRTGANNFTMFVEEIRVQAANT